MASGTDSNSNSESQDPYSLLGLEPGANFDVVQRAREERLAEVGDDPQARGRIEASYDALLMVSLKERQSGMVSNDAARASKKEEGKLEAGGLMSGGSSLLTRLKTINSSSSEGGGTGLWPEFSFPNGQGLATRIAFGALALVLLLVSADGSIEFILALGVIGLFISQIRRGRRPLTSLGWSVVLLSTGLILGGLLLQVSSTQASLLGGLSTDQIEALPAILLMWIGSLIWA